VQPGERVALWAPNLVGWAVTALGVHHAGAVLVPVNTRFKGAEAAFVLRRSRARLLFTVDAFLGIDYLGLLTDEPLDDLREVVLLSGGAGHDATRHGATRLGDFLARGGAVPADEVSARAAAVDEHDLCHILFTSGTTGSPKGVLLEHGAVCSVYRTLGETFGFEHGDRQLVGLPFFHSFGLHVGILCSLMYGMTMLPEVAFDPTAIMQRIARDRVTTFPGPPTVFQAMVHSPLRLELDLSSLTSVTIGAATIPPALVTDVKERLGVTKVVTGYGLTEASGTVSLTRADDPSDIVADTDGRPIPGVEVEIVDDRGVRQAVGDPGEILVRGYNVMRGYLDDPEATAAAIDDDGWLHTGDIGHLRPDGNLVVTDRKNDMYIAGGFNAYPAEIEAMLVAHPAIAQSAVIGVADGRLGEVGLAFVVPAPDTSPSAADIIAWAREHMANYKVPRYVEIVPSLPLNPTGKVMKDELRAMAKARRR
jgi:acyl-CoA synthetase (AMP-forming)/AMP-acid ligase II